MKSVRSRDIQRNWHLIDAKNKILGRLSADIAKILMGKFKNYYTPHLDTGDYVVIINAQDVVLSGKKENQKFYFRHSHYPGGLYTRSVSQIRAKKPEDLVRHAVAGMLPRTKLGKIMAKKLYVFAGSEHSFKDKFAATDNTEDVTRLKKNDLTSQTSHAVVTRK